MAFLNEKGFWYYGANKFFRRVSQKYDTWTTSALCTVRAKVVPKPTKMISSTNYLVKFASALGYFFILWYFFNILSGHPDCLFISPSWLDDIWSHPFPLALKSNLWTWVAFFKFFNYSYLTSSEAFFDPSCLSTKYALSRSMANPILAIKCLAHGWLSEVVRAHQGLGYPNFQRQTWPCDSFKLSLG